MQGKKRPIGVDLFAGAGGMTLGFEQAGFDVVAAVEVDPIHCATHKYNFPFWSILCKSVVDTTGEEIRRVSGIGDRAIDVVFGGPPCQGFSLMGKRALDDPRNELVFHFLRLVLELKPKYFVMENVPGLTIGKHKQFLLEIIQDFQANGYEVESGYQVLNATHYGVPQKRSRLFLLGCLQGLSLPKYPLQRTSIESQEGEDLTLFGSGVSQKVYTNGRIESPILSDIVPCPTVWDAIADLPEVENYAELLSQDSILAAYGKPSSYAAKLRGYYYDSDDYSYPRIYDSKLLTSSRRTRHTPETIQRFCETPPGAIEKISHFYKLNTEGVCNTLRAGTAANRGAFTSPRPIHPLTPRCITVREAARLHSYPDWFRFHVTKWHGFRQVGNSVPPLLAKAVAAEIIRALGISPVKPQPTQLLGDEQLLHLNTSKLPKLYKDFQGVLQS